MDQDDGKGSEDMEDTASGDHRLTGEAHPRQNGEAVTNTTTATTDRGAGPGVPTENVDPAAGVAAAPQVLFPAEAPAQVRDPEAEAVAGAGLCRSHSRDPKRRPGPVPAVATETTEKTGPEAAGVGAEVVVVTKGDTGGGGGTVTGTRTVVQHVGNAPILPILRPFLLLLPPVPTSPKQKPWGTNQLTPRTSARCSFPNS